MVGAARATAGTREAPPTHEIALVARQLEIHQDPADRFLVATARVCDLISANALVETMLAMLALHMATLTIRQLDDKTKSKLRVRAAQHGRSMEQEAREILRSALRTSPAARENLGKAIRERFAPLGGVDLELPRRDPIRQTARFVE